jgi:carboxymethylenebutenolidase
MVPWAEDAPEWDQILAAVEGHYGEDDQWAGSAAGRNIEDQLDSRGKYVKIFVYPEAGHAFFNDTRPEAYREDAAREAWVRTLAFLRAKLG